MKATFTHATDFRQQRDFGAKISATFEFITSQFRPLFKTLAYFVLPGALLLGIGLGMFFDTFMNVSVMAARQATPSPSQLLTPRVLGGLGLSVVGGLGAGLLLVASLYAYVRVRMALPAHEVVQPAQVWQAVRSRLGRTLLATLLLSVLLGGGGALLAVAAIKLEQGWVVLLFLPLVWVLGVLLLYFPVLWFEDRGIWATLRRSFELMRGKWWSTFGLYLIAGLLQIMMGYIFIIPVYAVMAVRMLKVPGFDSELWTVAGMSLYAVGSMLTAAVPLLALAFQYFNLVERREGIGMAALIASIGRTAAPEVSNATYRAEEEGEY